VHNSSFLNLQPLCSRARRCLLRMQALSELLSAPQSSPVFSKLLHPSDFAVWVTLLHPPLPASRETLSGLQHLDLSGQGMDIDQLAAFRDCLLSVPQVLTLKLCFHLPSDIIPTTLISQILCAFENLEELVLQHRHGRKCLIHDVNSSFFGKMLKSSPWLRVLDISRLIDFGPPRCYPSSGLMVFVDAVAEARHESLQLNHIRIYKRDFQFGSQSRKTNLNGMKLLRI
jgi:hypothetical protein